MFPSWLRLFFSCVFAAGAFAQTEAPSPEPDRSKLPRAAQNIPLERLSSGGLLLIDRDGSLVRPPPTQPAADPKLGVTERQFGVSLDPRVGPNVRLGDDPPQLPNSQRAQAEPHIFRSQTNPDVLLATFQEGRYATAGGGINCGYSVSTDGGLTWTRRLIESLTQSTGGPYFRATDPIASINLAGDMFLNTLVALDPQFDTSAIVLSKSSNGGQFFNPPTLVYEPADGSSFADKNWFVVNTFPNTATAGRIYVTWTEFFSNSSPIRRSYSDDGGTTWSPAAFVRPFGTQAQGSQPLFLPNGNVVIPYWNFGNTQNPTERLEAVISTDGGHTFGNTFQTPRLIANVNRYVAPNIRSGTFLPSAAVDRTTQNVYLVYQALVVNTPRILFTKSTNGGFNWSTPIAISDNPANTGVMNPAVNVSPDGQTVTCVFYDRRNNPGSTTLLDLYLAQSFDGGATWQPNIRVTPVATDASLAPLTDSGYMLGDYQALAESTNANVPAVPIWIDTRTGNPDPFVARVGISPSVNFTSWQAARLSLSQINNARSGGPNGDADGDGSNNNNEFANLSDPNDALYSSRPLNISTRLRVETGDNVLIGGFIITGSQARDVLLRGIGPSLTSAGVTGALQNPTLELFSGNTSLHFNNDWRDTQEAEIAATTIPPSDNREAAIRRTLAPGGYTVVMRGLGDTTGVGLVEAFDVTGNQNGKLANISTRGFVQTGDNVMIGGAIVGGGNGANGSGNTRLLVRALGPSTGVPGALADPTLNIFDGNGVLLATNDDWQSSQKIEILASTVPPGDSREAAVVITIPNGGYTAVVQGKNGTTGVALVEAYDID